MVVSLESYPLSKSGGWDFKGVDSLTHKVDESVHSILGLSTLRLQHCFNTPGHALNKVSPHLLWDILPLGLHTLPQLINIARLGWVRCKLSLEGMPQMLH